MEFRLFGNECWGQPYSHALHSAREADRRGACLFNHFYSGGRSHGLTPWGPGVLEGVTEPPCPRGGRRGGEERVTGRGAGQPLRSDGARLRRHLGAVLSSLVSCGRVEQGREDGQPWSELSTKTDRQTDKAGRERMDSLLSDLGPNSIYLGFNHFGALLILPVAISTCK